MLSEEYIDGFIAKYVKPNQVVSIGTNALGETFLKKLGLLNERNRMQLQIIPTSSSQIPLCQQFHLPIANLNEQEVDIAIEFVDEGDEDFNFLKRTTTSLVRDKMIAQSAGEVIAILPEQGWKTQLSGKCVFEISSFGWKRTLLQLERVGKVDYSLYPNENALKKTESGHYLVELELDDGLMLEELDTLARSIPGVLETGIFLGMADRLFIVGEEKIQVKSRMDYEK